MNSSAFRRLGIYPVVALLALSGGCAFKKPHPSKLSFLIEAKRTDSSRTTSNAPVLQVRTLQVAPAFEGKAFVYRLGELNYEADFYHEYLVPPRVLLTDQVRQWLSASHIYRHVVDSASRAESELTLEGNVSALYADFREKAAPKAVLDMEFFLVREQGGLPRIGFHRRYRQEVAIEGKGPEKTAQGWSTALTQILTALEQDLATGPK